MSQTVCTCYVNGSTFIEYPLLEDELAFLTEDIPPRGIALDVIAGVKRIVAPNPGPMTYHGTNTYLIETHDGLMVLDPGPDDAAHIGAVAEATAGRATAIILSHGHYDHCAGAAALQNALGVPIHGHSAFRSSVATIDRPIEEGDRLGGMQVLFTPGHAVDHICLVRDGGAVFTGDQVMAWSSSVVPFPSGNMADFVASLTRLADREDALYLCGHGPALANPSHFVRELIHHRLQREAAILQAVREGLTMPVEIVEKLYANRKSHLLKAAEHNVRAHLAKLLTEGLISEADSMFYPAP